MIVKNEAGNLPACLGSIVDLCDETIIVDTGSTDATRAVAARLGARVVDFAWVDDFAAARNESIRHATGEWIFWLDGDEHINDANRAALAVQFDQLRDENAGYLMKQRSPSLSNAGDVVVFDQCRVFRNRPDIRWQYRVHEQIQPAVERSGGIVRSTDIYIEHSGYQDPAIFRGKAERNLRLLLREDSDRPGDFFTLFNLGWTCKDLGQIVTALDYCQRALTLCPLAVSIRPKLHALIARGHYELGEKQQAIAACRTGRHEYPDGVELLFLEALALSDLGDLAAAEACLVHLLNTPKENQHALGADPGMHGYKARHNLARIYRAQGRDAEAAMQWQAALADRPDEVKLLYGLGEHYLAAAQKIAARLERLGAPGLRAAAMLREQSQQPPRPRMRVSLCMIVKNEAGNLPRCLGSVAGLCDEIIVVDTGSSDDTRDVARRLGARVVDFAWADDFAAARNESLRHATGEWIFWLDGDEYFDEGNGRKFRDLVLTLTDDNVAYVMKQRSVIDPASGDAGIFEQARLFRNRADIRWCCRVHEQILPALERSGCAQRFTDLVIEHAGYEDPVLYRAKQERNLRLLLRQDAGQPNDSLTHFHLGVTCQLLGRPADAVAHWQRSLKLGHPACSWVRKLYVFLAGVEHEQGRLDAALALCRTGLALYPDDTELLFTEASQLSAQGDLAGAEARLRRLIETPAPAYYAAGVDVGLRGYKARHNLALIYRAQQRPAEAEAQAWQIVAERPGYVPGALLLGDLLLGMRRWHHAQQIIDHLESLPHGKEPAIHLRTALLQHQARELGVPPQSST